MLYKYVESANKILNSKVYATEDLTLSNQMHENFLLFSFAKDHIFEVQHIYTNPEYLT